MNVYRKLKPLITLILVSALVCFIIAVLSACNNEKPPEIIKISIESAKTEYTLGESFGKEDITVKAEYSDGSKKTLDNNDFTADYGDFHTRFPNKAVCNVRSSDGSLIAELEVSAVRAKDELKILAIGNSFSEDSLSHVYEMAEELGAENIVLGNLYIGGCSIATHHENMLYDKSAYQYQKNTDGEWHKKWGWSMLDGIKDENWDVISLQQASGDSGVMSTYNSQIDDILQYIYVNRTDSSASVVWNMTWAYQGDSTHEDFVNYNNNQTTMYNTIVDCVKSKILTNKLIQTVIPTGTAIQNLRTALGDTVTRDGYHLSYTVGRYAAGMTWIRTLTGWNTDFLKCEYFDLTDDELNAIKLSVSESLNNPFAVTVINA